jgi:hypothetical protein
MTLLYRTKYVLYFLKAPPKSCITMCYIAFGTELLTLFILINIIGYFLNIQNLILERGVSLFKRGCLFFKCQSFLLIFVSII